MKSNYLFSWTIHSSKGHYSTPSFGFQHKMRISLGDYSTPSLCEDSLSQGEVSRTCLA